MIYHRRTGGCIRFGPCGELFSHGIWADVMYHVTTGDGMALGYFLGYDAEHGKCIHMHGAERINPITTSRSRVQLPRRGRTQALAEACE